MLRRMTDNDFTTWSYRASVIFVVVSALFYLFFIFPVQWKLLTENRVLTYWRAMHLTSGVSPLVPIFSVLIGLYLSFWFTLHGLALLGPDRPCLPVRERLALADKKNNKKYFLKMFNQEDAAIPIERAAMPFNRRVFAAIAVLFVAFAAAAFLIGEGVPVRSLGTQS